MADRKPPLGLHTEIQTAAGDMYRWDGNARDPGNRPQAITSGSKIGEGYGASSVTLARQGTRTYPDVDEFSTIRHIGMDGQIAYEGRIAASPRSARKVEIQAVGWMSHAHDTPFPSLLIIDRDLSHWGPQSTARRVALLVAVGSVLNTFDPVVNPDDAGSQVLRTAVNGPWGYADAEALYKAPPGQRIAKLYYDYVARNHTPTGANWGVNIEASDNDDMSSSSGSGDIGAASALGYFTPTTAKRFIHLRHDYNTTYASTDQYWIDWRKLTVYGDHGLTLRGADPGGVLASDVIRYVAGLWCPLLDTSGIQTSPSIIDNFAITDKTDAYEVFLKANAYDRYNIAVWENRLLTYSPMPSETADPTWIVRSADGNGFDPNWTGPSTAASANGVLVRFQNVLTGNADYVSPDTDATLADTRDTIAANRAGIPRWEAIQLPDPNSPNGAAEIGRAVLAEFNRPRHPGDITVRGHIRDAAGNWHQGWLPKAGETVLLEDDPDAIPQTIWDAQWNQDTKTLVMHVDGAAATSDSILGDLLTTRATRTAA
jgi:hypothetical protein